MIKKIIKQVCPPIIISALKKMTRSEKDLENMIYQIGKDSITLPPGHTLPKYQKRHKLFDRFLPVLASHVSSDKTMVDVGANVGDTAIMMHQTNKSPIICIEGSDKFYPFLENNISKLDEDVRHLFECKKTMVGTSELKGTLTHYGGTAKIDTSNDELQANFTSLDDLLEGRDISLIKVDTDGFDYDVLNSGRKVLQTSKPILFWENEVENLDQVKGYEDLYHMLKTTGYSELYIFDNFGNLLLEKTDFDALLSLNKYLLSMSKHACTRTFYLIDVLAATEDNKEVLEGAITDFKKNWIQSK